MRLGISIWNYNDIVILLEYLPLLMKRFCRHAARVFYQLRSVNLKAGQYQPRGCCTLQTSSTRWCDFNPPQSLC